jgi:hypothetical protein
MDVNIGCDGLSALEQCFDEDQYFTSSRPDFDLVIAVRRRLAEFPRLNWCANHIEGHQDDDKDAVLDEWAQQNVQMDTSAKAYRAEMFVKLDGMPPQHRVDYSPWMVFIEGQMITKWVSKTLHDHCGKFMILDYWSKKNRLHESTPHDVDWPALEQALLDRGSNKRRKMIKHSTGYFGHAANLLRWNFRKDAKCSRCEAPVEDADHIIKCQGKESNELWEQGMTSLRIKLQEMNTQVHIEEVIRERLESWRNEAAPRTYDTLPTLVRIAMEEQDKAGWDNAFYGRWVTQWAVAQADFYRKRNIKRTGRRWLANLISQLFKTAWDLWEYRNGIVHHVEEGIEAQQLNANILQEYATGFVDLPRSIRRWTLLEQATVLKWKLPRRRMWIRKIRAARTLRAQQYAADTALQSMQRSRNVMARFLDRGTENIGQVGQAIHQQREAQRARDAQQRQLKQVQKAAHAKTHAQLQRGLVSWISSSQ